jgi:hypothetical protein
VRRMWLCAVVAVAGAFLLGSARAAPKELALTLPIEQPLFVPFASIGYYNAYSSPEEGGTIYNVGMRFVSPVLDDLHNFARGYQLSLGYMNTPAEEIYFYAIDFLQYLPRSSLFRCDNHFFYGVGIGAADIKRANKPEQFDPGFSVIGGFQARLHPDIMLEMNIKYFNTPYRRNYDAGGFMPQIGVTYHFSQK